MIRVSRRVWVTRRHLEITVQTVRLTVCGALDVRKLSDTAFRQREPLSPTPLNNSKEDIVWNPCNIQMIPDALYEQIFIDSFRQRSFPPETIARCKSHLEAHSLWGKEVKPMTPRSVRIPSLQGVDINDHFRNIALQQTFRYRKLMEDICGVEAPPKPKLWKFQKGWTKYMPNGEAVSVNYPVEDVMIFDVEVCVPDGPAPTLACALTTKGWYSWCSDALIDGNSSAERDPNLYNLSLDQLIPIETAPGETTFDNGSQKEKIIIGHNVSYDRARIKEQYFIKSSKARFMDTMSLHIAVSGITSFQRALKVTEKAGSKASGPSALKNMRMESSILEWGTVSSLNNLADVYKLYCNEELEKAPRDVFLKGSMEDIRTEFQALMTYCASDVAATGGVFSKLLPLFYERFPHPVTLAGMLEMGTTYLPINSNWPKYIEKSEGAYNDCEAEIKTVLMQKADDALKLLEGERYKEDPWLWDLDWKLPKRKTKDPKDRLLPAWYRKLLYNKKDPDYMEGPAKISTSMQLVPKLLRLTWFGFPLHYSRKGGWGFLIANDNPEHVDTPATNVNADLESDLDQPDEDLSAFPHEEWRKIWESAKEKLLSTSRHSSKKASTMTVADLTEAELRNNGEKSAEELADFIRGLDALRSSGLSFSKRKKKPKEGIAGASPHPLCAFIPLPHKDGPNNRVGNPLAKDFLAKIEEGVLTCADDSSIANRVVSLSKMSSYWRNNRDRIMEQMTVWLNNTSELDNSKEKCGAIIPMVAVAGTLTRRAVEATWMTASNAYEDRIGSELKGMVHTPPSYHFVGADVDSQELWIASIIGDASFCGIHGSTALGWMTLQGNKSAGTDMHSKTASLIGIGRDQAKVLNYGRIYGAGANFAERLLMQFNRQLSPTEAKSKAKTMYKMTKGERMYILNEQGRQLCDMFEDLRNRREEPFSRAELRNLLDFHQIPPQHLMEFVEKLMWNGGTESHMFNSLEAVAQGDCPTTPILRCCISRPLVPSVVHNDFMTSRVNWVVQSSAVDYLHLMLTCMRWLIEKYNIDARFAISVHDEVRYLVRSEDRYRAALALQITNLVTRSMCAYQLGMYDLPLSVAFFSCVDVDKVLRKEVTQDCVTPSNPQGLARGYGVPLGQGLSIDDVLKLTNGSLRAEDQPNSGKDTKTFGSP